MGRLTSNSKVKNKRERRLQSALYKADVSNFGEDRADEINNIGVNQEESITPMLPIEPNKAFLNPTINDKPIGQAVSETIREKAKTLEDVENSDVLGEQVEEDVKVNTNPFNKIIEVLSKQHPDDIKRLFPQITKDDITIGDFNSGLSSDAIQDLPDERLKQLARDHALFYSKEKESEVEPAIERLGIQEYFPNIGESINVGSFTGRYIGSRSIYSAGGALVPFSILDARNRAIQADAEKKAKVANRQFDMINTAPQYNERLHEYVFDFYNEYYDAANGNIASLYDGKTPLSMEFLQKQQYLKDKAIEIKELDTMAEATLKIKDDEKHTVPDDVIEAIQSIRSAQYNMDDFLSGKGDLIDARNKIRSYNNMHFRVKEVALTLQDHPDIISLRPDVVGEEAAKNAMEAFVRKSGQSHDSWYSGVKKYFDLTKVEPIIDEMFKANDFYDETEVGRAQALEALFGYLPKDVQFKRDGEANDNLENRRLAFDREVQLRKSFHGAFVDRWNGSNVSGEIAKIQSDPNLTQDQKNKAIANMYAIAGTGQVNYNGDDMYVSNHLGKVPPQRISNSDRNSTVSVETHSGKMVQVAWQDYLNDGGKKYKLPKDANVREAMAKAKQNGEIVIIPEEERFRSAFISKKDGKTYTYNPSTRDRYVSDEVSEYTQAAQVIGSIGVITTVKNDKTGEWEEKAMPLNLKVARNYSLHDPNNAATLDGMITSPQRYTEGYGVPVGEGMGATSYD